MKDAEEGMGELEPIPREVDLWVYTDSNATSRMRSKIRHLHCPENCLAVILHAVIAKYLGVNTLSAIRKRVQHTPPESKERASEFRKLYGEFRPRIMAQHAEKMAKKNAKAKAKAKDDAESTAEKSENTGKGFSRKKKKAVRLDTDVGTPNKRPKLSEQGAAKASPAAVENEVAPPAADSAVKEAPPAADSTVKEAPPEVDPAVKEAPHAADPAVDAVAEAVKSVSLEADVGGADKPASDALIPPKQKAKMALEKLKPRLSVKTSMVLRDGPVTPEIDKMVQDIRDCRQMGRVDAKLLDELGEDGFKLNEPQKVEVRRMLQTLPVTKMAFLDTGIGAGKTATALGVAAYQFWNRQAAITFLVVPENIRAQWAREIPKLLSKELYTVWDIQMDQMPKDSDTNCRRPTKGSAVDKCMRNQWDQDKLNFVFIPPAIFNEGPDNLRVLRRMGIGKGSLVVVDEVHMSYRQSEKVAGDLMKWFIEDRNPDEHLGTIFVSGTPLQNRPYEPKDLMTAGGMRVGHMLLTEYLSRNNKHLYWKDGHHLMQAVSSEAPRTAARNFPNCYAVVCTLEKPNEQRRKSDTQRLQHGSNADVAEHQRYQAALAAIKTLMEFGGSVCVCANANKELSDFAKVIHDAGVQTPIFVITGDTKPDVYTKVMERRDAREPMIILITPQMAVGLDFWFLKWVICLAALHSIGDLSQVVGRMARTGQTHQTMAVIFNQHTVDESTYVGIQRKCDTCDPFYGQDPKGAVPSLEGAQECPLEAMPELFRTLAGRLQELKGKEDLEDLCQEHPCLVPWERLCIY